MTQQSYPRNSFMCLLKDMYYNVHSNTIHENLKLKITRMAIDSRKDKKISCGMFINRILYSNKNK